MAERPSKPVLTENQARHFLAVMFHADELLASAERAIDERRTPFPRLQLDVSEEERARLRAFVQGARERMAAACERLGIQRPRPAISARWSAETSLDFAGNSFADLEPGPMRGYGPVDSGLAQELAVLSGSLRELMDHGVALLHARATRHGDGPSAGEGG